MSVIPINPFAIVKQQRYENCLLNKKQTSTSLKTNLRGFPFFALFTELKKKELDILRSIFFNLPKQ